MSRMDTRDVDPAALGYAGRVQTRKRRYGFYAGAGTIIGVEDSAGPYLDRLARELPDEFDRALRHVGWWLRGEIKQAMDDGGRPYATWTGLSELQGSHRLDLALERGGFIRRGLLDERPFGHLSAAIGYRLEKSQRRVLVGWLSRKAAGYAARLQQGFTTRVTPDMRRMFFATGLHLTRGEIRTPGRQLIGPAFRYHQREIVERLELRIQAYLQKQSARAATRFVNQALGLKRG